MRSIGADNSCVWFVITFYRWGTLYVTRKYWSKWTKQQVTET